MTVVLAPEFESEPPTPSAASFAVGRQRRWFGRILPNTVLLLATVFFLMPLFTLARFAMQNVPTILLGWSTLFDKWSFDGIVAVFREDAFWDALTLSAQLAIGTVGLTLLLLLPTAIWVHMKVPRARAIVEFFTVLPFMIPAIALVAGIFVVKPHARWFLNSDYSLIPFYLVLALPFTYRSLDAGLRAIDLRTLVDASRSLGAGWVATVARVIVPNLRAALISASFLTAAVVMGEYTIADTLLIESLPPYQQIYTGREPQAGYGLNLLALLATTALFAFVGVLTKKRDRKRASFAHRSARFAAATEESVMA